MKSRWGPEEGVEKAWLPEIKRASAQVVKLNFMVVVVVIGEAMKKARRLNNRESFFNEHKQLPLPRFDVVVRLTREKTERYRSM